MKKSTVFWIIILIIIIFGIWYVWAMAPGKNRRRGN